MNVGLSRAMSDEMEFLRQRRALELRKKMLQSQEKAEPKKPEPPKLSARETVQGILAGRGVEVLETARRYYPAEVGRLEDTLAGMVRTGRLKGPISGEEFYSFLRRVGLVFSMDVKIRVKERGELKTLEQKFRESSQRSS
ncbi:MAG TPA: DNA-binding protein [Candidatus Bathyarchaeia archaeon]|nr:DNA-binding protein [Candidatus Bathyarchaeia archaeon]